MYSTHYPSVGVTNHVPTSQYSPAPNLTGQYTTVPNSALVRQTSNLRQSAVDSAINPRNTQLASAYHQYNGHYQQNGQHNQYYLPQNQQKVAGNNIIAQKIRQNNEKIREQNENIHDHSYYQHQTKSLHYASNSNSSNIIVKNNSANNRSDKLRDNEKDMEIIYKSLAGASFALPDNNNSSSKYNRQKKPIYATNEKEGAYKKHNSGATNNNRSSLNNNYQSKNDPLGKSANLRSREERRKEKSSSLNTNRFHKNDLAPKQKSRSLPRFPSDLNAADTAHIDAAARLKRSVMSKSTHILNNLENGGCGDNQLIENIQSSQSTDNVLAINQPQTNKTQFLNSATTTSTLSPQQLTSVAVPTVEVPVVVDEITKWITGVTPNTTCDNIIVAILKKLHQESQVYI